MITAGFLKLLELWRWGSITSRPPGNGLYTSLSLRQIVWSFRCFFFPPILCFRHLGSSASDSENDHDREKGLNNP